MKIRGESNAGQAANRIWPGKIVSFFKRKPRRLQNRIEKAAKHTRQIAIANLGSIELLSV